MSMSSPESMQWGRIADDGTVYVRTADGGEREIGSWQAGDREAGLAFYVRRYDDLATEVTLLERRLASGTGDPAATRQQAGALKEQLPTAAVIGDLATLAARLDAVVAAADEKVSAAHAAREQARADAIAAKEALISEAEQIAASSTSWKVWKQIRGVDRRTDDALWKRFAAARDAFSKRRGQHFAQLDVERSSARQAKEKLVERAEELSTSSDWRGTASAMRDLMTEWKAAPRAARDVEDALWKRFRAAQDAFFARRSETFSERDAEQTANLRKKEDVIARAEALDLADPRGAQTQLRELQTEYEAIGHVPRDAMRRTDERMRAAEQRVRDAVDAQWRSSAAHSNPFLAELRARLAEAESKLDRARRSGDPDRIRRAEEEVSARRALLPER
jgi:hypothetical protein